MFNAMNFPAARVACNISHPANNAPIVNDHEVHLPE